MRRALIACLAAAAVLGPAAEADAGLRHRLARAMGAAGSGSGAYVMDAESGERIFSRHGTRKRTLASNTKLFTSAAALGRLGADANLATTLAGTGHLGPDGAWRGNLYLRGGGDPTFGDRRFASGYGSDASVETLADNLAAAGFKRVTGRVYGDESMFDGLRGVPDSGWRTSPWIGPLSALDFDHGYGRHGFLADPAAHAARRLTSALRHDGVRVHRKAAVRATPSKAVELTEVRSPPVAALLRLQNKVSDNFFAEMLVKGLAVSGRAGASVRQPDDPFPRPPSPDSPTATPKRVTLVATRATTSAGARAAVRFAHGFHAYPHLVDGSGLSHPDRASPRSVARLLDGMRDRPDFEAFYDSLPIAGVDGTLDDRMRHGPAHRRCHAKTGTLTGVSALSGYCTTRGGRTIVFSFLMNGVNVYGARALQDRMAQAIARWRG